MSHTPPKDLSTSALDHSSGTPNFSVPTADPNKKQEHPLLEIIKFSLIALLIVIPIRMFVAQPFIVSGASMEDTFHNNEYLIVDQISYHIGNPDRGDVAIFRYPQDPSKFFIKRIIGVPGDTITIDGDTVSIKNTAAPNGFPLEEPYVEKMTPNGHLEQTLGEDEYFVMGDNRDHSSDSRVWGILQKEYIMGRALLRLFPPTEFSVLPGNYPQPDPGTTR
jgi:signal peptidase I